MGLKLRYNLFYGVESKAVYGALKWFWAKQHHQVLTTPLRSLPAVASDEYLLYQATDGWTLLDWNGGWEWTLRRRMQLHVSQVLGCAGLLVFVYDGDYWGYELFNDGVEIDHFVQNREAVDWFPDRSCAGQPEVFAAQFPGTRFRAVDIAPYLVPRSEAGLDDLDWNRPARLGDQFSRGDECAVLDFLRMLGVGIQLRDQGNRRQYAIPLASPWRAFKVVPSDAI
jgi:hypothetical protein